MSINRGAGAFCALLVSACSSSSSSSSACKGGGPAAIADLAQSVAKRSVVALAGGAFDAHGDISFSWRLEAVPPGSTAALSSSTAADPSFVADAAGAYVVTLTVRDACGTSAPATKVVTAVDRAPIAFAGPDQRVAPGATVTLDGSGSADGDADALTYQWSLITRPAASAAALSSPTAKVLTFVADLSGVYVALLIVSDGEVSSAPSEVVVQASNPSECTGAPIALAGPSLTTNKRASVVLSGSAVGRGEVAYSWQLLTIPAGSAAALAAPTSASPTFTTDASGVYVASLRVRDACGTSAPATTTVTVANRRPLASGGVDQHAMAGDTVTLDGSGSSDPDGDSLSYRWSFFSRPAGSTASFANPTDAVARFVPDVFGTYLAQLAVSDGEADSDPVEVTIQVGVTGPNGTCTPAAPPVASAGRDVSLSSGSVQLDGSGSTTGRDAPLVYKWSISSSPAGSLGAFDSATAVRPNFTPGRPGLYTVSLVVNDGCVDSAPSTATVTRLNNVPVAWAYGPLWFNYVLLPITLTGNGQDYDFEPLTCRWTLVSAPQGSTATIADPTKAQTTFTPDLAGSYSFTFVVSDAVSSSQPAPLTIPVIDVPPYARVGADQARDPGVPVALDGSTSSDLSNRAMSYAWTLQRPQGSAAALSDAAAIKPTFTPDVAGVYRAQLIVTAGGLASQPATTTIAAWPARTLLSHRVLDAAYSKALDRIVTVAADPDALYLYDPRGPGEESVALSRAPTSLGLSPDGQLAAVGHTNAISIVDLQQRTVAQVITVAMDVARLELGDKGFVYAFPRLGAAEHVRVLTAPLAGGSQTTTPSALYGPPGARLRSQADALYVTGSPYSYSSTGALEEYAAGGGTLLFSTPSSATNVNTCGDLWLSESQSRLFTRCGAALHASSSAVDDLTPAGTLAHTNSATLLLRHLDDSSAAGELSAIATVDTPYTYPTNDDRTLRRWTADGLGVREVLPFPTASFNGTAYQWLGRFVFYRSDGSERYVVLQLDPAAGALQDFAVATF